MSKDMNVFVRYQGKENRKTFQDEMDEVLKNISLSGSTESKINPIIVTKSNDSNLNHVLDTRSAVPRIHSHLIKAGKFSLILLQPKTLPTRFFNPQEIRCCVCNKAISYPAWHYVKEYTINHFHYFVCFDNESPTKPNTHCFRK